MIQGPDTGGKPQPLRSRKGQIGIKNDGRRWEVGAANCGLVAIFSLVACTSLTRRSAFRKVGGHFSYGVFRSAEGGGDCNMREDRSTPLLLEEVQNEF